MSVCSFPRLPRQLSEPPTYLRTNNPPPTAYLPRRPYPIVCPTIHHCHEEHCGLCASKHQTNSATQGATIVTAATTKTRKIIESKWCHLVKRQWPASTKTQSWARTSSPKARHREGEAQGDPGVVTEPPDSDSIRQGANIGDLTGLRATRETKTPPVTRLSSTTKRQVSMMFVKSISGNLVRQHKCKEMSNKRTPSQTKRRSQPPHLFLVDDGPIQTPWRHSRDLVLSSCAVSGPPNLAITGAIFWCVFKTSDTMSKERSGSPELRQPRMFHRPSVRVRAFVFSRTSSKALYSTRFAPARALSEHV